MLEARLVQGSLMKKVMEAIKDLIDIGNFEFSSTGFMLTDMDPNRFSVMEFFLHSAGFDHYHCDRNLSFAMNLHNLAKILNCAADDDILTIQAQDQDKVSKFEMKVKKIDSQQFGIPRTKYQAIFRMPSSEFARICMDLSNIADTVVISVTKEAVKFSARGDIRAATIACMPNTDVDKVEEATLIAVDEPVGLTFALKYMSLFTKATPLADQVTISLSSDQPAVVEYKMAEMGHIRFYLAPKIEEMNTEPLGENEDEMETEPQAESNPPVDTKAKIELWELTSFD
ncbi:proliferating cell nuclear antigen isoform X3 [Ziziphus jujuba]|uniref:DNA sliding clamp PCNA n=1 Tax=Ziziphus jujuba TaxID=326968 RepID=A0A6P6G092_ZIZJJ|nr:proliferating cell nuclear antigen isoform X3 [Ziziphus jujuba]